MNTIILITNIIQGCVWLFCALMLLMIKTIPHKYDESYRRAKRYMAFFCLTAFLAYVVSFAFGELSGDRLEIFGIYNIVSLYIINIFVFLAMLNLINSKKVIKCRLFTTSTLFIALLLSFCVSSFLYGDTQVYSIREYLDKVLKSPALILKTLMLVTVAVQLKLNINLLVRSYKNHVSLIDNYFVENDQVLPKWIEHMVSVTRILAVIVVASVIISCEVYDLIYSVILTFTGLYFTIKIGNYQNYFHTAIPAVELEEYLNDCKVDELLSINENDGISGNDDNRQVIRRDGEIEEMLSAWASRDDKPFLKSSITLGDVSLMTGISQRRLSKHINGKYSMTFNSWINSLKVEEVKRLLDHKNFNVTLTEIAYQCGFVDLPSMSNAFKKVIGISPSKYLKQ